MTLKEGVIYKTVDVHKGIVMQSYYFFRGFAFNGLALCAPISNPTNVITVEKEKLHKLTKEDLRTMGRNND